VNLGEATTPIFGVMNSALSAKLSSGSTDMPPPRLKRELSPPWMLRNRRYVSLK
jgi:hypothetical protein